VPDDERPPASEPSAADGAPERSAAARVADHATIDRLADDLVPALIAKLSASGLGEIEVGEGAWTIRVRRPADVTAGQSRRSSDRPSRSQPGHAGHGHGPASFEGHRSARDGKPAVAVAGSSGNGASPASAFESTSGGSHRPVEGGADLHRVVATSPAVGVFHPRADLKPGNRVRNGDRLGAVDMLGIPQEVVAPADGILGASLVETGQAVEYGQELIVIELAGRAADRSEV
jgi:biotin carboxyl carrier protein